MILLFQAQDIVAFLYGQTIYCVVFENCTLMYIKGCQVFFIKKRRNSLGQESSILYQCDTIFKI